MHALPNLDRLDDLERGVQSEQVERMCSTPDDTETRAKCLIELARIPGVTTADHLEATRR